MHSLGLRRTCRAREMRCASGLAAVDQSDISVSSPGKVGGARATGILLQHAFDTALDALIDVTLSVLAAWVQYMDIDMRYVHRVHSP